MISIQRSHKFYSLRMCVFEYVFSKAVLSKGVFSKDVLSKYVFPSNITFCISKRLTSCFANPLSERRSSETKLDLFDLCLTSGRLTWPSARARVPLLQGMTIFTGCMIKKAHCTPRFSGVLHQLFFNLNFAL